VSATAPRSTDATQPSTGNPRRREPPALADRSRRAIMMILRRRKFFPSSTPAAVIAGLRPERRDRTCNTLTMVCP
jgi:hypothetical protein